MYRLLLSLIVGVISIFVYFTYIQQGTPVDTPVSTPVPDLAMGVTKEIIQEGTGDSPAKGQIVKVHYTGTLEDGTKFDSSRDRNRVFEVPIGVGRLIKGWDEGICTMKKGERAMLTITPDYGYGEKGYHPVIPPNATLIFDVELIDFE